MEEKQFTILDWESQASHFRAQGKKKSDQEKIRSALDLESLKYWMHCDIILFGVALRNKNSAQKYPRKPFFRLQTFCLAFFFFFFNLRKTDVFFAVNFENNLSCAMSVLTQILWETNRAQFPQCNVLPCQFIISSGVHVWSVCVVNSFPLNAWHYFARLEDVLAEGWWEPSNWVRVHIGLHTLSWTQPEIVSAHVHLFLIRRNLKICGLTMQTGWVVSFSMQRQCCVRWPPGKIQRPVQLNHTRSHLCFLGLPFLRFGIFRLSFRWSFWFLFLAPSTWVSSRC